jgi:hypothetical protein
MKQESAITSVKMEILTLEYEDFLIKYSLTQKGSVYFGQIVTMMKGNSQI